jgi:hypothetical protein
MSKEFQWTDDLVRKYLNSIMPPLEQIGRGIINGITGDKMDAFKKNNAASDTRFEVVEYRTKYLGSNNVAFTRSYLGTYETGLNGEIHIESEKNIIRYGGEIITVKRMSDSEIFSVGSKTKHGIINKIEANESVPLIFYVGTTNYPLYFYEAEKVSEEIPLFKTQDGVDVFKNQLLCIVELPSYNISNCIKMDGIQRPNQMYFSDRRFADNWIAWNKHQLSLSEIMANSKYHGDGYYIFNREELTKLSKLKAGRHDG